MISKRTISRLATLPTVLALSIGTSGAIAEDAKEFQTVPVESLMDSLSRLKSRYSSIGEGVDPVITGTITPRRPSNVIFSHLPVLIEDSRLQGENDQLEWPIYVTPADIRNGVTFSLTYKNAVSVMPEMSNMRILVNDRLVAEKTIRSAAKISELKIEIPQHLLRKGYNSLRIAVEQRHRVDCSIQGTYELWTDIINSRSGIEYKTASDRIGSIEDLGAIPLGTDRKPLIRLLVGSNPKPIDVNMLARVSQFITLRAKLYSPVVNVVKSSVNNTDKRGIEVFVGSRDELVRLFPIYKDAVLTQGKINVLPSADGRSALVAALVSNMKQLKNLTKLPDNYKEISQRESWNQDSGGRAASRFHIYNDDEGKNVSFAQMGYREYEFSGRRFSHTFDLNLPADFYPADYDEIDLHLFGGYAAGLKSSSKLYIRVNGTTQVSMSVGNANGELFENKILKLPISSFSPGRNRVEIEAQLINKDDENCAHGAAVGENQRFFLSEKSYFEVPRVAHYGEFPNLSNTLMTGYPYGKGDSENGVRVYLSDMKNETIAAGVAFVTHISSKVGNFVGDEFVNGGSIKSSAENRKNVIVVGEFRNLPRKIAQGIPGIELQKFAAGWSNPVGRPQIAGEEKYNQVDFTTTAGLERENGLRPVAITDDKPAGSLLEKWKAKGQGESNSMTTMFSNQIKKLSQPGSIFGNKKTIDNLDLIDTSTTLLASQFVQDDQIISVVTAPGDQSMAFGMIGLMKPANYSGNDTVTFGYYANENSVVRSNEGATKSGRLKTNGIANMRLVLAGWLSNHPTLYAVLTLIMAIIVGAMAASVLKNSGRPRDGGL